MNAPSHWRNPYSYLASTELPCEAMVIAHRRFETLGSHTTNMRALVLCHGRHKTLAGMLQSTTESETRRGRLFPCAGFEKPCKVKPQPDASCTVEVDVLLRAFVPVLSAQSAAVAIRMLERLQQFEEYERFWRVRPQVRQPSSLTQQHQLPHVTQITSWLSWCPVAQPKCSLIWPYREPPLARAN